MNLSPDSRIALLAGVGGGAAEIVWVALYSSVTSTPGVEVARQVTASVFPVAADLTLAPVIGIAIHLLLSIALGFAFAGIVWRLLAPRFGANALMPAAIATLALVWAVNFFVVLPVLNPAFVTLMPYAATLASKLLFGVIMASIMRALAGVEQSERELTPRRALFSGAGLYIRPAFDVDQYRIEQNIDHAIKASLWNSSLNALKGGRHD